MAPHILLVEDSTDIAEPLVRTLEREGYAVTWAGTGGSALSELGSATPLDLIILDLGLPDMDGLEVCRQAREGGFAGGILICTARGHEMDRVVGLDYGADDYLAKPFGLAELHARVRALLRRTARVGESPAPATPPGLSLDRAARRVTLAGAEIALTVKEYDVLALLDEQRGSVVSREQLMADVWDENWFGSTKTLDVTIGRLRQKLEEAQAPQRVVAVRGVGFRLEDGPDDA